MAVFNVCKKKKAFGKRKKINQEMCLISLLLLRSAETVEENQNAFVSFKLCRPVLASWPELA